MSNIRIAQRYLLDKGWTPAQVAGIIGNLQQESGPGLKTTAVGDGGNSYGIAQWNGPRRRAFKAFAAERGKKPSNLMVQLDYLDHELRTTERAAADALRKTKTAAEAAKVFSDKFERPGTPHMERRIKYAQALAGEKPGPVMAQQPDQEIAAGGGADALMGQDDDALLQEVMAERGDIQALDDAFLDKLIEEDAKADASRAGVINPTDLIAATPMGAALAGARRMFPETMGGVADAFMQGTSLGFSDEMVGAANAATQTGTYEQFANAQRAKEQLFREQNPVTATGAEIAGNIVAAAPLALGSAGTLAGRMAIGAGEGAAFGAVEGAGKANAGDRAEGALRGGAAGATIGAAVPVVGAAVAPIARPVINAASDLISPIRAALGLNPVDKTSLDLIEYALEADQKLARQIAGKPDTLLDLGGKATRRLADEALSGPSKGASAAEEFLENRVASQGNRISEAAGEFLGVDARFVNNIRAILERRTAQTRPLYRRLSKQTVPFDGELARLMQFDDVAAAFNQAIKTTEAQTGRKLTKLREALQSGNLDGLKIPFGVIDNTKKNLDAAIRFSQTPEAVFAESSRQKAGQVGLKNLKRQWINYATDRFKGYASVLKVSADEASLVDAANDGTKFLKGDVDAVGLDYNALSEAEKEAFRMGAAREIRRVAETTPSSVLNPTQSADAANRLIRSKDLRRRLLALSDKPSDYRKFMASLRRESQYAKVRNETIRGSQTKGRLTSQGVFEDVAQLGENIATGGSTQALPNIIRKITQRSKGLSPEVRSRVLELLTSRDVASVQRLLADRRVQRELFRRENLAGLMPEERRLISRALVSAGIEPSQSLYGDVANQPQ